MGEVAGRAAERDGHVLRRLAQSADDVRMYLREWIQAELKDARVQLQLLDATSKGVLRSEVRSRLQRVNDIDRRELREIEARFEVCLRSSGDRDPGSVRTRLEEGLAAYERLVRELLALRTAWTSVVDGES